MIKNSNSMVIAFLALFVVVCSISGISFAYFSASVEGEGKEVTVTSGMIEITYAESDIVKPTLAEPIYDSLRESYAYSKVFQVAHSENSGTHSYYKIELKISTLPSKFANCKYVKYELINADTGSSYGVRTFESVSGTGSVILANNINLPLDNVHNYMFRIWLSYDDDVDQSSLLTGNSSTAIKGQLVVTAQNGART